MNRRKSLIRYVVPSVLSMVSFFLFTVIDGIFVGTGVGTAGLGAINIVWPYIMILNGVAMLFTIGGLTITAIRIGRGDTEGANQVFIHSMILIVIVCAVLGIGAVFFTEPLCRMMGATDVFIDMAKDYLWTYGLCFIPVGVLIGLNGFCRNDDDPVLVTVGMVIATSFNVFGDWLFIFPLGMGLKGAAIATDLAQILQIFILLTHFIRKKGILGFRKCRFDPGLIRLMIIRGFPECISQFSVPVSTIVTNLMLVRYIGEVGVNSYSVICYVASFSVAVFAGCAEGLQPLFGQCYGAKREKDLKWFFKCGLIISITGALLILVLLGFVGKGIFTLYSIDAATMKMTMESVFKFSWGFPVQAVTVMISSYLYSTTRTKPAIIINVLRTFAVNVAVILIVPAIFGADSIWYTFGIFETIVMTVSVLLLFRYDRRGVIGNALE